jgi:hypothetical protein
VCTLYRNHYGLAAAVFTTNLDSAIYISNTLRWETQDTGEIFCKMPNQNVPFASFKENAKSNVRRNGYSI